MMFFLISDGKNRQSDILLERLNHHQVSCQYIDLSEDNHISVYSDGEIKCNNFEFTENDFIFWHNIDYYFPFISGEKKYDLQFDYHYLTTEQKTSHNLSFITAVSRKFETNCDFMNKITLRNRFQMLNFLKQNLIDSPEFILTNHFSDNLKNLKKINNQNIWSYPEFKAPLRTIIYNDIPHLFSKTASSSIIMYDNIEGIFFRSFFYRTKHLLTSTGKQPTFKNGKIDMGSFNYFTEEPLLTEAINRIRASFKTNFLEIYGVITSKEDFIVYGFDLCPDFSNLGYEGAKLLTDLLLSEIGVISCENIELINHEKIDNIALDKMLEVLFG